MAIKHRPEELETIISEPTPSEVKSDYEITRESLESAKEHLGAHTTVALLPYIISFGENGNKYFLAITNWEFNDRLNRSDSSGNPLKAYAATGAGFFVPESNPKKIYGQIMPNKPYSSPLLANRIVNVPNHPYGNYSRSLRLQIEPSSSYRNKVEPDLASLIRSGAEVKLVTLSPSELHEYVSAMK